MLKKVVIGGWVLFLLVLLVVAYIDPVTMWASTPTPESSVTPYTSSCCEPGAPGEPAAASCCEPNVLSKSAIKSCCP